MSMVPDEEAVEASSEDGESSADGSLLEEDSVAVALRGVEVQIARFHDRMERQEHIIRTMQERIAELQGDQVLALLKPTLIRFASLHAQATDAAGAAQERAERAANDLAFFATAIEESLGLLGMESVGATSGDPFDSSRHAATGTAPTSQLALDKTVSRVVRQGFTFTDAKRVTIPAQVTVYRYDETLAPADASTAAPHHHHHAESEAPNHTARATEPEAPGDAMEGH